MGFFISRNVSGYLDEMKKERSMFGLKEDSVHSIATKI
jgi:hypothetical protein